MLTTSYCSTDSESCIAAATYWIRLTILAALDPDIPYTLQSAVKCPSPRFLFFWEDPTPHLIHCFLSPPSPYLKRHLDEFIRFSTDAHHHGCWGLADSQTVRPPNIGNNRPQLMIATTRMRTNIVNALVPIKFCINSLPGWASPGNWLRHWRSSNVMSKRELIFISPHFCSLFEAVQGICWYGVFVQAIYSMSMVQAAPPRIIILSVKNAVLGRSHSIDNFAYLVGLQEQNLSAVITAAQIECCSRPIACQSDLTISDTSSYPNSMPIVAFEWQCIASY